MLDSRKPPPSGAVPDREGRKKTGRVLAFSVLSASLCCYLLFFHRLADRDLWSSHEARAAMNAQGLLDSGDWVLPHLFDGTPELQKPPLYYWLTAAIAWLQGGRVDAWSVRLPAVLSALGCLVVVGLLARRRREGLLAVALLATAIHFTWLARTGRIDMPLTLTVSAAIGAFWAARFCRLRLSRVVLAMPAKPQAARQHPHPQPLSPEAEERGEKRGSVFLLLVGYVSLAAGVLLKGPIGLILPVAVLLVLGLVERRWILPGLWWGLPLVALLVIPWYWSANVRTEGAFCQVFFWYHNIARGLGGSQLRSHPWWFYGLEVLRGFLPWSLLLPAALWWCRRAWRRSATVRLGLVWWLTVTVLLSCARFKRADYLLPAYPGLALFLAGILAHWSHRRLVWIGAGLCSLVWLVHVELILPRSEPAREWASFASEVRRSAPVPEEVILFRTEAHVLAFHLGRPLTILVEWQHLADRLARPGCHHVVMPPEWLEEARQRLPGLALEEVLSNTTGRHDRPLVLLLTTNARSAAVTSDCLLSTQCGPAGPQRGGSPRAGPGGLVDLPRRSEPGIRVVPGR